ncbi:OmpA family protein [Bdellovibrionota bacterium FG-1]
MHINSLLSKITILSALLTLYGCAGESIRVSEFPTSADPSVEIARLDKDMGEALNAQVDVTAPVHFRSANSALKKAQDRRASNDSNQDILKKVAEGDAYLARAREKAAITEAALDPIIATRGHALAAKADRTAEKDFASADEELLRTTMNIEKGNTSIDEKTRGELLAKYKKLELDGVREAQLGDSLRALEQAKTEGAKEWAPKTLVQAENMMNTADAAIQKDPNNPEIAALSKNAKAETDLLMRVTRQSKLVKTQNPEETVLAMEKQNEALTQMGGEAMAKEKTLGEQKEQLAVLGDEAKDNERFTKVSAYFTKEEAEVLKNDKQIIVRLKGLNFPVAKSTIPTENFALLKKVQNFLAEYSEKSVTIEGHTDSVGSKETNQKISEKRADAVKDYLVANNAVTEENVKAEGKGFAVPVATNKTKEGRAQNRRVDIILTPPTG